jgi:uncharacterized protein YegL
MKQLSMTSLQIAVLSVALCYVTAELTVDPALCKLDLVLCLDNTGSIAYLPDGSPDPARPPINWKRVIDFAQDIVKQLSISPTGSQVGLVDFGGRARIQFGLTEHQTQSSLVDAIAQLPYIGDTTNTTGGLFKSRQVLSDPQYGLREGKSKVLVLVTDGKPNVDGDTVLAEAQNCRDAGIRVIVVGITESADEALMKQIAYSPDNYIYAKDFSDLDAIQNVVLNDASCKPLPIKPTTPPPPPAPAPEPPIEC